MKICTRCHQVKDETDYFLKDKESGRLHAQCKLCYKEHRKTYHKTHYEKYGEQYRDRARKRKEIIKAELQSKMLEYLANKACVVCGESDIRTLEFDHIDPSLKSFNIARGMTNGLHWDIILKEIGKCRVLCANCHKKHTAETFGWYRNI